jgi:hypothetical protein
MVEGSGGEAWCTGGRHDVLVWVGSGGGAELGVGLSWGGGGEGAATLSGHRRRLGVEAAMKTITKISVVTSIIDCNVSLHGNNHDYCNNVKKPL